MDTSIIKQRIETLREELESGRQRLAEVEAEADLIRQTLLRISGAIQVLEDLAAEGSADT